MISEDAFYDIYSEYERQLFQRKSIFSKIMIIIAVLFLIVILSLILFIPSLMRSTGFIIVITSMGIVIIVSLILGMQYKSEKPFFEYLIKLIVQDIYKEQGVEYSSFVKNEKHAIIESGLFPKGVFMSSKGKIKTNDVELFINKNIYFTDGRTTHQYFYGYYMVLPHPNKEFIQIRSKGKPYYKAIKWQRIDVDSLRVYIDEASQSKDCYLPLLEKIKRMHLDLQPKSIYMMSTKQNLHFAYEPQAIIKRPYNISYESFKELYQEIEQIIKLPDIILSK